MRGKAHLISFASLESWPCIGEAGPGKRPRRFPLYDSRRVGPAVGTSGSSSAGGSGSRHSSLRLDRLPRTVPSSSCLSSSSSRELCLELPRCTRSPPSRMSRPVLRTPSRTGYPAAHGLIGARGGC
ncbi:hypothetical protein OCO_35670 [Mycobacterium intracellulare MOTT-02]|uniref:Uncharacterized protein n=2 Tax=Mycobacterium intracellulare TaxID=1767 RepID=X8CJL3_MYCIT|nr:hypothetical protein OCU_35720 [Mycobacterium intracellulare ATCC 13950]AFC49930.1 hypothetical protein OCO_35670 [Mycobacterium intracellulare MOTT-02]ETZ33387.1 hypothetical protein L843_3873 [Mycobacterium intracellulare MIN_061107_1834]EUA55633.1 hypothetical protein I550_3788 [Mycobacterium intracellulare 1956]